MTSRRVEECAFLTHGTDECDGWLGASPDGLLPWAPGDAGAAGAAGGGILEIKCPFNRGSPERAVPWRVAPWWVRRATPLGGARLSDTRPAPPRRYYLPQTQGLMEVFDRDWCHLYCWTENGSAIYRYSRHAEYFGLMYEGLAGACSPDAGRPAGPPGTDGRGASAIAKNSGGR